MRCIRPPARAATRCASTPWTRRRARTASIIARQIVDAIPNGELKLRYQPLVSARDGHVVGMEALLRWQSPTLGMLVPERFMRTAERLGIIVQIGTWVLEGALKQARLWRDQGFDDFTIAVNVSTPAAAAAELLAEVMGLIQPRAYSAQMLTLEINESALTNNVNFVHETLANLRNEGISLSLDNFGTGDSSLSARALPGGQAEDRPHIERAGRQPRGGHRPRDHRHGPSAGHDGDRQRR